MMMQKPPVIFFLKLYAVGLGFLYLAIIALFGFFLVAEPSTDPVEQLIIFGLCVFTFGFALVHFGAVVINRQKWGFAYGLALIVLGLTSCGTWPVTVPLLLMWLKPENKAWFDPASQANVFS